MVAYRLEEGVESSVYLSPLVSDFLHPQRVLVEPSQKCISTDLVENMQT